MKQNKQNLKTEKYYKFILNWNTGKVEKIECINHSYTWSGKMPCTGIKHCMFCGKIFKDDGGIYKDFDKDVTFNFLYNVRKGRI